MNLIINFFPLNHIVLRENCQSPSINWQHWNSWICIRCCPKQRLANAAIGYVIVQPCDVNSFIQTEAWTPVRFGAWDTVCYMHQIIIHSCYRQPLHNQQFKCSVDIFSKKSLKIVRISMMHFKCIKKRDISSHTIVIRTNIIINWI